MDNTKVKDAEERQKRIDNVEETLITEGILVPASDFGMYVVRNNNYLKLINSQQFKDSGIKLEEVLDDDYIKTELEEAGELVNIMRFATEEVIPKMQERLKTTPEKIAEVKSLIDSAPVPEKVEAPEE